MAASPAAPAARKSSLSRSAMSNFTAKRWAARPPRRSSGCVPLAWSCPAPCAQMTESTLPLMMRPGIGVERELGLVARLDLVQLVLVDRARRPGPSVSTSVITGASGKRRDEAARPQLQVDRRSSRTASASSSGRAVPLRALELGADLRDLRVFAVHLRAELLLDLLARWPRPAPRAARACASALRAAVQLALELREVRFGLLEVELRCRRRSRRARGTARRASARARASRSPRRCRAPACSIALLRLGHLALRALQLLLELALLALRVGELRLERVDLRAGTAWDRCGTARRPSSPGGCLPRPGLRSPGPAPARRSGSCT